MLNPECGFSYEDIDLQHVLSQHHWYVSGYRMGFNHPLTEAHTPLFRDEVDLSKLHEFDSIRLRHKDQRVLSNHC